MSSSPTHSLVFHLAARNIIASTANPRDDFATNIGGTLNVLLAARESKVDRVVYTSSASVYGNPRLDPDQRGRRDLDALAVCREQARRRELLPRRSTRATACRWRRSATRNVYGPGQRPDNPYCGVVSKFLVDAHAGRPLSVHGDGEQTRDYTYIDDAVEATLPRCDPSARRGRDLQRRHRASRRRSTRSAAAIGRALDIAGRAPPHRPPRHRQHPAPRREHREGTADASLDPAGHPRDAA